MIVPQAVLVGSLIIAGSIIGTKLMAPYQLSSGPAIVWRLNTVTGEFQVCDSSLTLMDRSVQPICR